MALFAFENPTSIPASWNAAMAGAWLLNGYDHWPIPSDRSESEGVFSFERAGKESVLLATEVPDAQGLRTLCSSTLRPNTQPYRPIFELARGALNRLRNLAEAVATSNILLPVDLHLRLKACTAGFGRAVASEPDEQRVECMEWIGQMLSLSDSIMDYLAERRLRSRIDGIPGIGTRFGCALRESPGSEAESHAYCSIFDAVRIEPVWKSVEPSESQYDWNRLDRLVEWAASRRLAITIGPVIDFIPEALPDWLYHQSDLPLLAAYMDDFLGTVVARYRRYTDSFQVFAGLNSREEFDLPEDDRLRLAARLIESATSIDPRLPWSYCIREPFGDYLRSEHNHYSPLVFVDTLQRSGHETTSIGLDVDSGTVHDALDLMPLLDHFSSIIPQLSIEFGGNRTERSAAFSASLVRTALGCEPVQSLFWARWSRAESSTGSDSSILYDGGLTPLGTEFETLRTRWWPAELPPL